MTSRRAGRFDLLDFEEKMNIEDTQYPCLQIDMEMEERLTKDDFVKQGTSISKKNNFAIV